MELDSLTELYVEQLMELYDAERQLVAALPRLLDGATSKELRRSLQDHLDQTRLHLARLEAIFDDLERSPGARACTAMTALIEEADEVIRTRGDLSVRDAALICCVQKIEHYEIAVYGCARTFADLLGATEAAESLLQTLEEEERSDRNLTYLAKGLINIQAAEA